MINIDNDLGTHYYVNDTDWRGKRRRRRVQRFFCLGGPFDGQHKSSEELRDTEVWHDYNAFNNAGISPHTMIFIHDDLIHED